MRLKLSCDAKISSKFPYNYNYELQNIIYRLIDNSSPEFSSFLHSTGYVVDNRPFKLFTFSKLFFKNCYRNDSGFSNVSSFDLLFSTAIQESYEHLVLGIFSNQQFTFHFSNNHSVTATITSVESLPEPKFVSEMNFIVLSPVVISTNINQNGRLVQHFLDYMDPKERDRFKKNILQNLLRKYKLIHKKNYQGESYFDFNFNVDYILKHKGVIRKKIRFKKNPQSGFYSQIIGMEAPFTIKADPELIKIGYQCGFGEKNSAGFGMVEFVK